MSDNALTFAQWIEFEAARIVRMGLSLPEEDRADYMRVQIEGALWKATYHGRDGLRDDDPPRAVRTI